MSNSNDNSKDDSSESDDSDSDSGMEPETPKKTPFAVKKLFLLPTIDEKDSKKDLIENIKPFAKDIALNDTNTPPLSSRILDLSRKLKDSFDIQAPDVQIETSQTSAFLLSARSGHRSSRTGSASAPSPLIDARREIGLQPSNGGIRASSFKEGSASAREREFGLQNKERIGISSPIPGIETGIIYYYRVLHVSMIRLLLRLLISPSRLSLNKLYCDRLPMADQAVDPSAGIIY